MKKFLLLVCVILVVHFVSGQSYMGTITRKTPLYLVPKPSSTNLKTLEVGSKVFVISLKTDQDHYNVVDIESNYEGFVPKNLVKIGSELKVNKNGMFTEVGKSTSSSPEANIFNNTKLKMTIKIDQEAYTFNPGEKKKLTLKAGTMNYRASAPGVLPSFGSEVFKNNRLYTWEFYIQPHVKK